MFPEVAEKIQKSYKQDRASQKREEVLLKCFSMNYNEFSMQFVLRDTPAIIGPNDDT